MSVMPVNPRRASILPVKSRPSLVMRAGRSSLIMKTVVGIPGEAATVEVGSVVTGSPGSSVTVTNSGTDQAAVLDFSIPAGNDGLIASIVAGDNIAVDDTDPANPVISSTAAGLVDGDYGDATVGGSGTTLTINAGAITPAKMTAPTLVSLEGLSLVQGDILYATAADTLTRLPKGTALQGLQMNSGATAPAWYTKREILTANRTYYVRKDGSDSNTGLADNSGGAFLTIQKAINVVFGEIDLSIYNVTIQVRSTGSPTTYAENLSVTNPRLGKGSVTLTGDTSTPANITIGGSSHCLTMNGLSEMTIRGFKLNPGGNNHSIYHTGYATTFYGEIEFAGSVSGGGSHLNCIGGGLIQSVAACTITGGGAAHINAARKSSIVIGHAMTVTGTPAFSSAFAISTQASFVYLPGSFSGSATGTRYSVTMNAVMDTLGGGASAFPGNAAGSAVTGGQYA